MIDNALMEMNQALDRLKKVWLLTLIDETGSLKGAAARAGVSSPAVSQAISLLESSLGKPVLFRGKGRDGLRLNEAGKSLIRSVEPIYAGVKKLEEATRRENPTPCMSYLNFGAYESLAIQVLPGLVSRLRTEQPNLRIRLRIARSHTLASLVRSGELCMALVTEGDYLGGLEVIPLAEDRLGVYVSARVPIPRRSWKEIMRTGIGAIQPGPQGHPRYYQKFVKGLGIGGRDIFVASDSFEALRAVSLQGATAAILPTRVARVSTGELVEITPPDLSPQTTGAHRICLISETTCDPLENEFLARELRALF